MARGFSGLSYKDKLRYFNPFPLSHRRLCGDLILAYRVLNDEFVNAMFYIVL